MTASIRRPEPVITPRRVGRHEISDDDDVAGQSPGVDGKCLFTRAKDALEKCALPSCCMVR